ncbi:MAG: hypothetical protein ACXVEI_10880 [Actinomycetota bacterium]
MSEMIDLRDYERAETGLALKDARRGFVIHGGVALLSLAVHAFFVLRAQRSIERRQARIEHEAFEERRAA